MRFFVEVENSGGRYHGGVYGDNHLLIQELPTLRLGPQETLYIKDREHKLKDIIEHSISFGATGHSTIFDERGQLEIGQFLYDQTFGALDAATLRGLQDEPVEVRIVTNDEHIARLPWVLLSSKGIFLSTTGWSVALSSGQLGGECELPPSPRLLFVMPEAAAYPATGAAQHLEALEDLLSRANHRHTQGLNLRVVKTWEDFIEASESFRPHVVYFYGHGIGDLSSSSLIFTTGSNQKLVEKSIADVANCLRQANDETVRLAYINCCLGDAGGLLGVGRQLGDFIPAVITNCTYARTDAAQAQAETLLRSILINGAPPHAAIANMRSNLTRLNFSFGDMRWMTPVLHCHYQKWKTTPPQPSSRLHRDPHWRYKLDRIIQFSQVSYQTQTMLAQHKPRSLAYIWYGRERQGVDLFHQRIKVELREGLTNAHLYEVLPTWPMEFSNFHRSMTAMMTDAFGVQSLSEIPDRIRTEARGVTDRLTLVYVRHEPIRDSKLINIDLLKSYLEWWNANFAAQLEDLTFGLLGVSYVIGKSEAFGAALEKKRVRFMSLNNVRIRVLKELGSLQKEDLIDFIETHNIALPEDFDDQLLDKIIEECHGEYEAILERLKNIEDDVWPRLKDSPDGSEDFN